MRSHDAPEHSPASPKAVPGPGGDAPCATRGTRPPRALGNLLRALHTDIDGVFRQRDALAARYDPDAIHALRVGLRRLQTMADVVRRCGLPPAPGHLLAALRGARRGVGAARDADVMLDDVLHRFHRRQPCGSPRLHSELHEKLASRRHALRDVARTAAVGALDAAMGDAAAEWLSSVSSACIGVPARRAETLAATIVGRAFRRANRAARRLRSRRRRDLHPCRIAMKELRYTVDALMPIAARGGKESWISGIDEVQRQLGRANDACAAGATLGAAAHTAAERRFQRAFGDWAHRYARRRMRAALRAWRPIKAAHHARTPAAAVSP